MKHGLFFLILTLSWGCALTLSKPSPPVGTENDEIIIAVKNTLRYSTDIYYKPKRQSSYVYLGKLKAGEEESFKVNGPFSSKGFILYARRRFGSRIQARLPHILKDGKVVSWEIRRSPVGWTESTPKAL